MLRLSSSQGAACPNDEVSKCRPLDNKSDVTWAGRQNIFPFDTNKNSSSLILPHSLAPLMNELLSAYSPSCLSRTISCSICHSPNSICHLRLARLTHSAALPSPRHSRNHFMLFSSCRPGPALSFLSLSVFCALAQPSRRASTRSGSPAPFLEPIFSLEPFFQPF